MRRADVITDPQDGLEVDEPITDPRHLAGSPGFPLAASQANHGVSPCTRAS
jgi:hypothetical protein